MASLRSSTAEKPTVNDIARVAGVSLATVDRVLNDRPGVRVKTREKVQSAIRQLGYVRDTAAANLARRRVYRLVFLLPKSQNEFVEALAQQIEWQAGKLIVERTEIRTISANPFDPMEYARALDAIDPNETDGVAVFGPETPSIRDAVKHARDRGVAVVALVSDLPASARDHYVGIDNIAAGRTAARLIGRFVHEPGEVLVITGSRLSREHLERRSGFDDVISAEFPKLSILPSVEAHDGAPSIWTVLERIDQQHPDLRAVYASTSASPEIVAYFERRGLGQKLVFIAHELTPLSRKALHDGVIDAVISQNSGHIIRSAVRLLRATADSAPFNEMQERIRIDIHLKDNLAPA